MPEKAPLPITVASSGMQKYGQAHSASPNRVPHLSRCSTSASNAARSSLIEAMRQERLAHANFCRAAGVSSVAICETTSGGKSSSQDRRCHTLIPEELFALAMASIVRRFLAGGGDSSPVTYRYLRVSWVPYRTAMCMHSRLSMISTVSLPIFPSYLWSPAWADAETRARDSHGLQMSIYHIELASVEPNPCPHRQISTANK